MHFTVMQAVINFCDSISFPLGQVGLGKKVVVGMSGGVDSSVAAIILKLQGYQVIGIFMKNWDDTDDEMCSAKEDFEDVRSVCEHIGIEYYSVNFIKEYNEHVFSLFLEDIKNGHTPNPDILCNKEIKFKAFYDMVNKLGADFVATGHYCQTKKNNLKTELVKGVDKGKDQSYFLYAINSAVLSRVLFPIGGLEKKHVRTIAELANLSTAKKKDSTGICFIGERNFKEFISGYLTSMKGNFVTLDGKIIKEHDGACFYTRGQRKGLGIGGPGGPWFVTRKNIKTNEVIVVEGEEHPDLFTAELRASEMNWLREDLSFPLECYAKVRYRQPDQKCTVYQDESDYRVIFKNAQRAVTVKQSIVLYDKDICLGGGVIEENGPTMYESKQPRS